MGEQVNWNMKEFYLKGIINGLKKIQGRRAGMKDLKCGACGREAYKGIYIFYRVHWNTKAGRGSGFDCEIKLDCDCGRVSISAM